MFAERVIAAICAICGHRGPATDPELDLVAGRASPHAPRRSVLLVRKKPSELQRLIPKPDPRVRRFRDSHGIGRSVCQLIGTQAGTGSRRVPTLSVRYPRGKVRTVGFFALLR